MLLRYSLLFLCLLHVYSCIKLPPDFDAANASNVYTGCRLKKTTNKYPGLPGYPPFVRVFAYNSNNDPVSITNSVAGTGSPNIAFKYDDKKRLIQYAANYTGGSTGSFEPLHRHGYSYNRVSTDTVCALGNYDVAGQPVNYFDKRIAYLQYDNFGRVVQDSTIFLLSGSGYAVITNYHYDNAGNLIPDQGGVTHNISYDNKLNPHRTNKIWMFIDRDYSVNNPGKAATYNNAGLPLSYSPGAGV